MQKTASRRIERLTQIWYNSRIMAIICFMRRTIRADCAPVPMRNYPTARYTLVE